MGESTQFKVQYCTSDILLAFSTASGSTPAGMGGRTGGGVANVGTGTTPGRTLAGT